MDLTKNLIIDNNICFRLRIIFFLCITWNISYYVKNKELIPILFLFIINLCFSVNIINWLFYRYSLKNVFTIQVGLKCNLIRYGYWPMGYFYITYIVIYLLYYCVGRCAIDKLQVETCCGPTRVYNKYNNYIMTHLFRVCYTNYKRTLAGYGILSPVNFFFSFHFF